MGVSGGTSPFLPTSVQRGAGVSVSLGVSWIATGQEFDWRNLSFPGDVTGNAVTVPSPRTLVIEADVALSATVTVGGTPSAVDIPSATPTTINVTADPTSVQFSYAGGAPAVRFNLVTIYEDNVGGAVLDTFLVIDDSTPPPTTAGGFTNGFDGGFS